MITKMGPDKYFGYGLDNEGRKRVDESSLEDIVNVNPKKCTIKELREQGYGSLFNAGFTLRRLRTKVLTETSNVEKLKASYEALRELGVENRRIVSFAETLKLDEDTLRKRYQNLRDLGFPDEKIAFHTFLLTRDPTDIKERYEALRGLGIEDTYIQRRTETLLIPTEKAKRNYARLRKLGLPDERIRTLPQLLPMNQDNLERNYRSHRRFVSQHLLRTCSQLLGIPAVTVERNVQFLRDMGIDYNDPVLLGTNPNTKRKKMAWMLREAMDYRSLTTPEAKRDCIHALRMFVQDRPMYLGYSIAKMEREKDKLDKLIAPYKELVTKR